MKLTDRIYLVGSGSFGFNLTDDYLTDDYDCHVYLLDGGSELALVDTGAGRGTEQIVENVRLHGFDPGRIRHLLLTHAHIDHAGGVARLRTALDGPRVYLGRECAAFLREGDEQAVSLPAGRRVGLFPENLRFEACPVDVELQPGSALTVGDLQLEAIETPGHSAGHCSFLLRQGRQVTFFAGDLVFHRGRILLQNTWDCDLRAHLDSLIKMRDAGIDILLPGHLTLSLSQGQNQIDTALRYVDGLLIPPNLTHQW